MKKLLCVAKTFFTILGGGILYLGGIALAMYLGSCLIELMLDFTRPIFHTQKYSMAEFVQVIVLVVIVAAGILTFALTKAGYCCSKKPKRKKKHAKR
jgi:hypothetical protein